MPMAKVVEHEQDRAMSKVGFERLEHGPTSLFGATERPQHRVRQQLRVAEWRQIGEPCPIDVAVATLGAQAQSQARFADPARTGERDQAGLAEQLLQLDELP